ncbi:MAG TPA: NUDIX domain-containing protein [Flavisolibacter sp.]|nr:NUDIX domain-containing protein [Flavisolibacter sp.]
MKKSAGILLFKKVKGNLVVFLVHPGGPFWKNKDEGAWSIPKGEFANEEDPLLAAQREFEEETGQRITGDFVELKPVKLKSGKMVYAWAVEGDVDADHIVSNTFKVEWPYKSGRWQTYPEVDKAAWLTLDEARKKINMAQTALLDELENLNG